MPSKPSAYAAIALIAALTLTGCAAGASSGAPKANKSASTAEKTTPAPEPTIGVGDELTADQAAEINAGTDLLKAYPVGDTFYAVQWGQPIPEPVVQEVTAQVKSGLGPNWGRSTDLQTMYDESDALRATIAAEQDKLGGISISVVAPIQSFSEKTNSYHPMWTCVQQSGGKAYGTREEAQAAAKAWVGDEVGKRMYVVYG